MLKKILIANRGEIACRIIRTARRLQIKTVVVYSSIDQHSKAVEMADEAIQIGDSPAKDSYLQIDKIVSACQKTGAEAIHPGYGFLSENPLFASACEKNNIIFIGPDAAAIAAMANKDKAKAIMQKTGIPITPGFASDNLQTLKKSAKTIGTPLLIKATSGGGGKGMRIVKDLNQFDAQLASAKREAKANFNDDSVFIEKYIDQARHVEVQICRDQQGNTVHLFDRDCSVQRRHQKIIEEAPAPFLSDNCRQKMFAAACKAADAVNYYGVGTVEFLVTPDESFYFMEMNTRLQVEHPVTEEITGIDLVEWQFLIADKQPLPLKQKDIIYNQKYSIEVRLCAENPSEEFKPSTGMLEYLFFPGQQSPAMPKKSVSAKWNDSMVLLDPAVKPRDDELWDGEADRMQSRTSENLQDDNTLRIEVGYREEDTVSVYYDSLLGKLICTSHDRESAIKQLVQTLIQTVIIGVNTNRQYLLSLLQQPHFLAGKLSTQFIDQSKPPASTEADYFDALSAITSVFYERSLASNSLCGFRLNQAHIFSLTLFDQTQAISIQCQQKDDTYHFLFAEQETSKPFTIEDKQRHTDFLSSKNNIFTVTILSNKVHCQSNKLELILQTQLPIDCIDSIAGENLLLAKMPSTVVDVLVQAGESVSIGDQLMILEAMKIETTITAPKAGVIKSLFFQVGDVINEGALLLEFEEA